MLTPENTAIAVNALLKLRDLWPAFDAQHRTYTEAHLSASARALKMDWPHGDAVANSDLQNLAMATQVAAYALANERADDPYSDRWASALLRTNRILAEQSGYKDQDPQAVKSQSAASAVAIFEVIALIVGALAYIVVMMWVVSKAAEIVDNQLARNALERELVRIHSAALDIVTNHGVAETQAGKQLPWSEGELSYLTALEQAQATIIHGTLPSHEESPLSMWKSPWPWLGISAAAVVVLGIVYETEIKAAVGGRGGWKKNPAAVELRSYVTTYCNRSHDVKTGKPIGHNCYILPPAAIRAEMRGDYDEANKILSAWHNRVEMRRGMRR